MPRPAPPGGLGWILRGRRRENLGGYNSKFKSIGRPLNNLSAKIPSTEITDLDWKQGVRRSAGRKPAKPKSVRAAGLLLLAASPFLAYIYFLPSEQAADIAPENSTMEAAPSPSATQPDFPTFVVPGDLTVEPISGEGDASSAPPKRPRTASSPTPETNGTSGTAGPPGVPGLPEPIPFLTPDGSDGDDDDSDEPKPKPTCDAFSRANNIPGCSPGTGSAGEEPTPEPSL